MTSATAQNANNVLITQVASYLGYSLAQSQLSENCLVYGLGNSPLSQELLVRDDFTLLEQDLSQPLPSHLPRFDYIFYLDLLREQPAQPSLTAPSISPILANIISPVGDNQSKLIICAPINTDTRFFDHLVKDSHLEKLLKLLLIGDLYGPKMPLISAKTKENKLAQLIFQAAKTDKIVLPDEGLEMIYPAYISDVIFAIHKFVFSNEGKNIEVIASEDPKTSLSVAYEIQNILNITTGKQVDLFFAPSRPLPNAGPTPDQKMPKLDFLPKVTLRDGLTNTFKDLSEKKLIERSLPTSQPAYKPQEHPTAPILENEARHLAKKISPLNLKPRLKLAIITILVLFFLATVKTAFDLYSGVANLKKSEQALIAGNFQKSAKFAVAAANSFRATANQIQILTLPISPLFGESLKSLQNLLVAASVGADSLRYLAGGAEILAHNYLIIAKKDLKHDGFDLETPQAFFKKAYFTSAQAQELARLSKNGNLLAAKIDQARNTYETLNKFSSALLDLTNLTDDLTGSTSPKTYLVLLQNNTELRPGGGFIGNFGLIEFADGRLENMTVEDIYTIDGQLAEKIEPPKELSGKLALDRFYLRDSNWSPDFTLNASNARDFYRKETGKNVDGVIAIDLSLIQNLLSKIGPIKLDDYGEQITAENLFERGEYWSEVGFFPGSTQKRDFFSSLTRSLLAKVISTEPIPLPLIEVLRNGLSAKHLMMTFDDSDLASYVRLHSWDHPLPPVSFNPGNDTSETRDFLAPVEANLGANKANRFLGRKINYEVTVGRDADLVAKLTIIYKNNSQAETWPAGKYVNFLRVYVPAGADLIAFKNGDNTDLKSVEVTTTGSLTTLATFVEVPIKSTQEVIFNYRIPKNINLEKAATYHLYVQKQPGTDKDPFEFTFNLPNYLKEKESGQQNLKIPTDLATDREFEVEIIKK